MFGTVRSTLVETMEGGVAGLMKRILKVFFGSVGGYEIEGGANGFEDIGRTKKGPLVFGAPFFIIILQVQFGQLREALCTATGIPMTRAWV